MAKFCSTSSTVVSCFIGAEGGDEVLDHDGRQALGRLVDQEQPLRVHEGAGDGEHLLLAAGERARARVAEAIQIGEEDRACGRGDPDAPASSRCMATRRFSSTVERGEYALPLGHEAHAEPRDLVGRQPWMARPSKRIAPRAGCRRPMMLRMVVVLPAPFRPMSTVTASPPTR